MLDIKVTECYYHRNGISGVGFYALSFNWTEHLNDQRYAIATVSSDDFERYMKKKNCNPETRVLCFGHTGGVDLNNTMRGDYFHEALCEWLVLNPNNRVSFSK